MPPVTDPHVLEMIRERLPREARYRYFQKGNGPMFVWTVEPFNTAFGDAVADGKYESVVYRPVGRGSRTGDGSQFKRDEKTASLHVLRRDAKTRALGLYTEWLEQQ